MSCRRLGVFLAVLFAVVGTLAVAAPPQDLAAGAEPYAAKQGLASFRKRCPLCDASVYPYCSEKLLHDACCCLDPLDTPLPHQCVYADCSFLHANSCKEHKLITACCCNRGYFFLKRKSDRCIGFCIKGKKCGGPIYRLKCKYC